MSAFEIHYADGWAALYRDGVLIGESVGDSYIAEEMALRLVGVKAVHDDSFMRGQTQRTGVALTLDQVREYRQSRGARQAEAERLRSEAAALIDQARTLEETPLADGP